MPRDIEPGRDPHLVVALHVIEEAGERGEPPRPAGQPAVQTDRQHARPLGAFRIEHVEAVAQVVEELVAGIEALRCAEAHVVGVERIGHDELRAVRAVHPVGQLVGVGVGGIEESLLLHRDVERADGRAALVEAERAGTGDLGVDADRLLDVRPLLRFREVAVVDPLQAVRRDLPAGLVHGGHGFAVPRHRRRDREHGHRQPARREQPMQPPETDARAELVDRFHAHVPLPGPRLRTDDLRQERLRRLVAVQDAVLPAFLVVDHELHRDPRIGWPARMWRIAAVADEIAGVARSRAHDLAPAIGRIAPRRGQQRHVVVPVRLGDRETQRHAVEERRLGQRHAEALEIRADLERQHERAGLEGVAGQQRLICTAVRIRPHLLQQVPAAVGGQLVQRDGDAARRLAVHGVENVRR